MAAGWACASYYHIVCQSNISHPSGTRSSLDSAPRIFHWHYLSLYRRTNDLTMYRMGIPSREGVQLDIRWVSMSATRACVVTRWVRTIHSRLTMQSPIRSVHSSAWCSHRTIQRRMRQPHPFWYRTACWQSIVCRACRVPRTRRPVPIYNSDVMRSLDRSMSGRRSICPRVRSSR